MIRFNNEKYEKIASGNSLSLFGVENKKMYLFNETSQYIFESIMNGNTFEDTVNNFCLDGNYDINIIRNDFKKTLDYLLKEEILYEE